MKRTGWFLFCIFICLLGLLGLFSACDPDGDDGGGGGDGTDTEVPAAPDSLSATVSETDVAVDLSWQDNSDNESGFVLERKLNAESEDGFVQILGNLGPDTLTICDDANLETAMAYEYRVKAFNDNGDSDYSNWAYVYIPLEGGSSEQAMTGFVYTAWVADDGKLWYTWDDPQTPENNAARIEVTDAQGPTTGHQSGTDISADFDAFTGTVYTAWVALDGKLWYTWDDPQTPENNAARIEVTDAGGPTTGHQSGTAI
ncbi:MAG: fibronectin type III domain-containing protein, partial [Spirochaetales bacterium]|nr:fibronectin type III domain-containing protein [Spirochaetales bacterium]